MARAGVLLGPRVLRDALRLLFARPALWPWAALPFLVNVAAFALAIWAFVANLDALAAPLERALDVGEPVAWYAWIWVGPLLLVGWLLRWLLLALLAVVIYFAFTAVGSVIAAPFLDVLSERVETLVSGRAAPPSAGFRALVANALRSMREEAKRTAFFLAVQLGLLAFALVPGVQPVAAAASLLFAALFLPLDYTGYALDRRQVPFRARRRWITAHPREMLGFGSFGLATFFVPGLSFLCLPWLVTAGTLLVHELGAPAE